MACPDKCQLKNSTGEQDQYVEAVVCKTTDINENEMKVFDLDDGKVLLVKQHGEISALGTQCTHYKAPLEKGVLSDGRIRCQWHGACFNIKTGDIEDFPGLDSLPCHQVTIDNGQVKVRAKRSDLTKNIRTKLMAKNDGTSSERFVIIGGGPAAQTCAETLRQEGFKGVLTMVARENAVPYDRVKISKALDIGLDKVKLRSEEFFKEHKIDILKQTPANAVNTKEKTVSLCNGEVLKYDKLFIATGSKPNRLDIPGKDLKNVFVIRTVEDGLSASAALSPEKNVVIIGTSFIAMESASFCANKCKSVTILGRDSVPFKMVLGEEVGAAIQKLFEENGVKFRLNIGISSCDDDGKGNIKSVSLCDKTQLPADVCIMGTGSKYYTEFLQDSGINLRCDGGIEVDQYTKCNVEDVFVGGDIAHAPIWSHNNIKANIGHYSLAHYHGHIAAKNMLNQQVALKTVPFFFTMLFGKGLRYCGHGQFDDVVIHGNAQELKFVAFYLKHDEVIAVCTCQMDPVASQFAERLNNGKKLYRADLVKGDELAWTKEL